MVNKILFLIIVLICFTGCNNERSSKMDVTADDILRTDTPDVSDPLAPIWDYSYDSITGNSEPVQLREVDRSLLTGKKLEDIINIKWPRVPTVFKKVSNDTAYIFIPDSQVLTQQMGSAGAQHFMVITTYTFTELKGINYVNFDFEMGDHANPGTYKRDSWKPVL